MLDVHPPRTSAHTWRDFFIHIATIVVGLFIAIGLEQSVEALHRRQERTELLAALNRESRQIVDAAAASEDREKAFLSWDMAKAQQVKIDIQRYKPYAEPLGVKLVATESPDNPIYKAAKASGKLALLSDQEIATYGELDRSNHDSPATGIRPDKKRPTAFESSSFIARMRIRSSPCRSSRRSAETLFGA